MNREKLISLVTQAQSGDSQALDALFTEFYNDVYYFALKTVKDSDTACDITQETFLEIIRTIGNLKEPAAFVTWMKQITYHQCTRYFNKKKDELVEEDEDGNTIFDSLADESEGSIPSEVLEKEEFRQTILAMIDKLTEEQRSAVMMYYFDELTVGQIAQIQGVSEGTVKSRLNYARKAVRKSVEDYEKKTGIKLHSFAFLPLFFLFFGKELMPEAKAAEIHTTVTASANATMAGTVGAASATAATASTSVGVLAKLAQLPLVGKIIAGILAIAVVVGLGSLVANPKTEPNQDNPQQSISGENENAGGEVGPVKYKSQLLEVYNETDKIRNVFRDYAGDDYIFYWNTNGGISNMNDAVDRTQNYYFSVDADIQEYCMAFKYPAYRDSRGILHLQRDGAVYPCPDLKGEVFYYEDDGWQMTVCSVDKDGCLYLNVYDNQGTKQGFDNTPLFLLINGEYVGKVDSIVATSTFHSSFFAIANGYVWENSGRNGLNINDEKPYIDLGYTGIAEGNLVSHDVNHQYIYHEDGIHNEIIIRGYTVSLPDGKTVDDIALAMSGFESIVIFNDGSVYIHLSGDGDTLIYSQELTDLYKAGAIRKIFTLAKFLILMDDNVTYKVNTEIIAPES